MMLTIFTPTYNRAHTLSRTYDSLCRQTCNDFEWLVIDDGSFDNTEQLVLSWINVSNFPIRYYKIPNGGKYRAYNYGLECAKGEFFFCVDSDDWLPKDSVNIILSYSEKLKAVDTLSGIVALKMYQDNGIIGSRFSHSGISMSLYTLELKGEGGERSIVFKTDVARKYPFPMETSEKYLGESVIYDRLHTNYEFIVSNDVLTICEYQPDGLSSNVRDLMLRNPAGYKLYFAQRIDMTPFFTERLFYVMKYHAFRHLYKGAAYEYDGVHKFLVWILTPISIFAKLLYIHNR